MSNKRTDMTSGYACVCVRYRSAWAYLLLRAGAGISKHMSAGIIVSEKERERARAETYSEITYRKGIAVAIAAAGLVTEGACGQQTEHSLVAIVSDCAPR